MRIANITFHKVAMAAATVTAAAGTAVGLTSCTESLAAIKEYPCITNGSPSFIEAKKQTLDAAKQDPDIKHNCLGKPIKLLGQDTSFVCKDGRTISIYPENGTKQEVFPNGRDTTYSIVE